MIPSISQARSSARRISIGLSALPFFIVAAYLAGCSGSSDAANTPGAYRISGTLKHLAIEGRCWQFTTDSGDRYQPTGKNIDSLLHDGIHADLIVRNVNGVASICMTGKIVEVLEITSTSQP